MGAQGTPTGGAWTDVLMGHGAQFVGSLVAIAIGAVDGFGRAHFGIQVDLGLIVIGLGGLGLQAGGLPRR